MRLVAGTSPLKGLHAGPVNSKIKSAFTEIHRNVKTKNGVVLNSETEFSKLTAKHLVVKEARNSFFGLGVYLLKSNFRIEDKLRFP